MKLSKKSFQVTLLWLLLTLWTACYLSHFHSQCTSGNVNCFFLMQSLFWSLLFFFFLHFFQNDFKLTKQKLSVCHILNFPINGNTFIIITHIQHPMLTFHISNVSQWTMPSIKSVHLKLCIFQLTFKACSVAESKFFQDRKNEENIGVIMSHHMENPCS